MTTFSGDVQYTNFMGHLTTPDLLTVLFGIKHPNHGNAKPILLEIIIESWTDMEIDRRFSDARLDCATYSSWQLVHEIILTYNLCGKLYPF